MTSNENLRAGVIGLGMIGGSVASNLAAAGIPTTVFDVRADAIDRIAGIDEQAPSPAEVGAASDVVLLAVVNADQARDVLGGPDGVLSTARRGSVVVLLSTVSLPAVRELSALCAEAGVDFLDAGVTQAGGGKLVVMLGGDQSVVETARPVLEAFTRAIVHCGDLGTGMVTKLARNAITYGNWAVVREAVSLAVRGGVDPERILEVMDAAAQSGSTPGSLLKQQIEAGKAGGAIPTEQVAYADGLAQKDLGAAQEFAGDEGIETPIIDVVRPRMRSVYAGDFTDDLPEDRWDRGIEMMHRVYGDQQPVIPRGAPLPAAVETVEHLFGEVWARGNLTMRDRRLLALGATAMLGRQDLLENQLRGAIGNGEFTTAQLREMEYFLNSYTGVQNGAAFLTVVEKLIAQAAH